MLMDSNSPSVWGTFIRDYSIHAGFLMLFVWLLRPKKSILGPALLSDAISIRTHLGMRILAGAIGLLDLLFAFICFALFMNPDGIEWGVALPCSLITLGMLFWVWKVFTFRIEADAQGLRYSSAFRKVVASWADLVGIQFKNHPGVYLVTTSKGGIPIATTLDHVPLLLKLMQQHRPDLFSGARAIPVAPVSE